jgi:flavin reductase
MRRLASGVSIVTTIEDGQPHGFTATSVTSVSADPVPLLLVCVSRSVTCHDTIVRAGKFCVNLLHERDIDTAKLFTSPENRHRRFERGGWDTLTTGAPVLRGALASFDCNVYCSMVVQTHTVLFGRVEDIRVEDGEVRPLLYIDGQFAELRSADAIPATA